MWTKGKTIDDAVVIGIEEGRLYKLKRHLYSTITTSTIIPCDIWHRIIAHVNYKAFPFVRNVVIGLPEIHIDHEGVCKGCAQGKNMNKPFLRSNNK